MNSMKTSAVGRLLYLLCIEEVFLLRTWWLSAAFPLDYCIKSPVAFEVNNHKITCQCHCLIYHFSQLSISPKEDLLCTKSAW